MTETDIHAVRGPSMTDVARAAGVSAQTVSRTLRDSPNVNPETRRRVLLAVEQLGYRLNNAARMLSSGRSRTLGLVLLQSGGYYSRSAVTAGVESAAEAAGLAVSIATIASLDTGQMERSLSKLADQGVEGIVIAVPLISVTRKMEEITREIPTVTVDGSRTAGAAVVGIDQRAAGRLATEHLLTLGHGQVWHVGGPDEWIEARQRRQGWEDALVAVGIEPPPPLEGDWSPASGHRQGQILAMIPDVSAVFVASDEMAFGVIRALREHGRRVPDDVSIVSVDDIALAAYCSPPLTTVRQDFHRVGAAAVDLLLAPGAGRPLTDDGAPELVVRATTAAPAVR
ncbi:LacI family transcriptional regulator [Curtobacterium sp. MCBD17_013]|uniref:LacI family DNA-binding transcriptional regulator n=1 Tax=unclassified Curtobacterium TaxID=257496 RepID=UPI000DA8A70B|nr:MULTISPECIES: LacI family DNA-binding transcriptional regulator [unclassified Curtobacterium]PZE73477.1 LacI family transcriptional regulator [Curtobacterium sp. MCBD17_019]PZF60733.1 LacI family transcriptional regulator [Curtobacterium sp. MCBD17_013]WIB62973.1 LacI family DNA-binding transcriptional regulator [Curtobacterium sp. MCBD17_040]WIB66824.1 LacI family DNA-binding transcriptional regulator [Curtobacterium sp. MCBD17_035]